MILDDDFGKKKTNSTNEYRIFENLLLDFPGINEDPYTDTFNINGWIGQFNLALALSLAIELGASDLHITSGKKVAYTILGDIVFSEVWDSLDEEVVTMVKDGALSYEGNQILSEEYEFDGSYIIEIGKYNGRRFRVSVGRTFGNYYLVFRVISDKIPTMEELGIEREIREWFNTKNGAVLICGVTDSGKSTSMSSLIRDIQKKEQRKVITIEKPVEMTYPNDGKGLVIQRAVPDDTKEFTNAITSALRQNPDYILIGEIRSREEISEFLRSAETGHMAMSTIHASNCVKVLNRIRSSFSVEEQPVILETLGDVLKGIVTQVLIKNKTGDKRFAVKEILNIDWRTKQLIQKGDFDAIRREQEKKCKTLEHKLLEVYKSGKATLDDCRRSAPDTTYFDYLLEQEV